MVISCGQDEPHRSPKKAYFSCVIGIYLMSFFYDHPVFYLEINFWLILGGIIGIFLIQRFFGIMTPQFFFTDPRYSWYRVIIKEGQKVNAYYTAKICLLGASIGFILTKTYQHLFIYTKDLKYFTINVI